MYRDLRVSVAMPALNEEEGIVLTVRDYLNHPFVDEVVVADNNSKDNTFRLAQEAGAKVVSQRKRGYGISCQTALDHCTGDILVLTESDGSMLSENLDLMFPFIDYFDVVKGARSNRFLIDKSADWDFLIMFANWALAKYMQLLFIGFGTFENVSMREVGGTQRIMHKSAYRKIRPFLSERYSAFLPDMVSIMLRHKMKILELPVRYRAREGDSKITGNRLKATLLSFRMFLVINKNRILPLEKKKWIHYSKLFYKWINFLRV